MSLITDRDLRSELRASLDELEIIAKRSITRTDTTNKDWSVGYGHGIRVAISLIDYVYGLSPKALEQALREGCLSQKEYDRLTENTFDKMLREGIIDEKTYKILVNK